jgi:hypothetical protein
MLPIPRARLIFARSNNPEDAGDCSPRFPALPGLARLAPLLNTEAFMNTRTVLFLAGSTASLAAGAAFALQTVRKQPAEATPVTAIAAPVEAVGPVAPTVAENVTPLTARMVQTVFNP